MEDQALPANASPTVLSPGYVVDSDPEKDEKDPKEDPADYPADRGNNDDDESSNDDDVEKDEEDKVEEEHLAPADPSDVSTDELELSEIGSPRVDDHEHLELLEMLEDPYVEVSLQALPFLDYIPGPEEPEQAPSSPDYVPGPEHADDEIVDEDQPYAKDASPIAQSPEPHLWRILSHLRLMSSQPHHRYTLHIKKLGIALGPGYEVGESSSAAAARPVGGLREDYGFVTTMDREIMRVPERESERQLLAGRLNILFRDRCAHAYTRHLMETEARMSREAWVRSADASDLVRGEVMSLRTTVLGQMTEIR
nr:hypothetical protein [Tanacetum cinerariifolium]